MKKYQHLFFDMDQTIAPARQTILPEMYQLLTDLPQDIVIVSGQEVSKIRWQSNNLPAIVLGQNGNHAIAKDGTDLWNIPLSDEHRMEIMRHIEAVTATLDYELNPTWTPVARTAVHRLPLVPLVILLPLN